MIELTKNILQKSLGLMEENSYHNLCIMEKAVVNPYAYVTITNDNIQKVFNATYNKNAKYTYFTINGEQYIKLPVNVNLNSSVDNVDRRNSVRSNVKYEINRKKNNENSYLQYITLYERGIMNRHSTEVYCNGYKIPDKNVLVTLFSGSIDIYIPTRYTKKHSNLTITLILNRYDKKNPYYNSYSNNITSTLVRIPFIIENDLDLSGLRIYKNGVLCTGWVYDTDNAVLNLEQENIVPGDEVEFIYRTHTQYNREYIPVNKVITFDKDMLYKKPIFADIVEIYINGVRQFPSNTQNVSPRHISLNNFTTGDTVTYYLVYDETFPDEKNKFIDDLTQFFDYKHEDASVILNGEYTGHLPEYIKHVEDYFPPEVIKVMNENIHKTSETMMEFLEKKSKEYIAQNAENFKYLLNNLTGKSTYDHYYDWNYISTHTRTDTKEDIAELDYQTFPEEKVVFVFDIDDTSTFHSDMFIVDVDGVAMNMVGQDITYYNRNKVYLYLPKRWFTEDMKIARILHFTSYNTGHKHIDVTSNYTVIPKNSPYSYIGYIHNINDLFVMRRYGEGYAADLNIERTEDEENYYIAILDYNELEQYIIYNAAVSSHKSYTVTKRDIDINLPVKIPYDYYHNGVYLPMASLYSCIVVMNGHILNYKTDYMILTQFNNPTRDKAELILGVFCKEGDVIEIYYTESMYDSLTGIDYINSEYGVIYFRELNIPFDTGYLDLYVNGSVVPPEDIEIISTNMIKVSNVPNLINVGVRCKLDLPLSVLDDYINTYLQNPSLWDEYIREYWSADNKIDDFYLQMHPDAEKVPSDPYGEGAMETFDIMVDLVSRCFVWGLIPRLIDCAIYYDYSNFHALRELMIDKNDYIELNCNKYQLMNAMNLDAAAYMKSYDEVIACADAIDEQLGVLDADTDIPADSPLWLEIYPDELTQAGLN